MMQDNNNFNVAYQPPPLPPPPPVSLESMARFMILLNERWPIDRAPTGNFNGNHSLVFDTTGLSVGQPALVVSVWIWKQLEWRNYPVGLTPDDLRLSPEQLIIEIARVLEPEIGKLIVPSRIVPPR
jgi:hypothetical protein